MRIVGLALILWNAVVLRGQNDTPTQAGSPPPRCVSQPENNDYEELFGCDTAHGKRIQICGEPDGEEPEIWKNVHYRFGPLDGTPELMFPAHPENAPPSLFYSTEKSKADDLEAVRFSSGGYNFRVYFGWNVGYLNGRPAPHPEAFGGVEVTDAKGKRLSNIDCTDVAPNTRDLSRVLPHDPKKAAADWWAVIEGSQDPKDFDRFVQSFPNIDLARTARIRAAQLRTKTTVPVVSTRPNVPPTQIKVVTRINPKDGLAYAWIPAGTFTMGCSPGDSECVFSREKPAHEVTITKGFWIGQTEVTQEAYRRVIGHNTSNFKGNTLPVDSIGWTAAHDYCEAAGMRLPTEAEWEYAARGGSTSARYDELDSIAWYDGNSAGATHPVGLKRPNAYGLYDMLGNVAEWTDDLFGAYSPVAGADPQGPPKGDLRVLRGGSFGTAASGVRASRRLLNAGLTVWSFGIRCVASELPTAAAGVAKPN